MNKPTEYALITGASSGIGVEFAKQLVARGYSLILTARRIERLNELKQQLEDDDQIVVQTVQADLDSESGVRQLFDTIRTNQWQVSILINNAGLGYYESFFEMKLEKAQQMIQVNLSAATQLVWLFGNEMIREKRGYILNVSSYSAFQPPDNFAVYAATKSYTQCLTQAIAGPLKEHGVSATALCPGFFHSEFFEKSGLEPSRLTQLVTLSGQHVSRAGLRGMFKRKRLVVPGIAYQLSLFALRFLPRSAANSLANWIIRKPN